MINLWTRFRAWAFPAEPSDPLLVMPIPTVWPEPPDRPLHDVVHDLLGHVLGRQVDFDMSWWTIGTGNGHTLVEIMSDGENVTVQITTRNVPVRAAEVAALRDAREAVLTAPDEQAQAEAVRDLRTLLELVKS